MGGKLRCGCGWRWGGGRHGSTGEGFRRKNDTQDLLKFQTLTESEVWEVGDSLGIFLGGRQDFCRAEVGKAKFLG